MKQWQQMRIYSKVSYLKRGAGFFRILFFFTKKNQFLHWNETDRFQRVLKIFKKFFVQNEAEESYFINQKFFTPLTSFLPHFFDNERYVNFSNLIFCCF